MAGKWNVHSFLCAGYCRGLCDGRSVLSICRARRVRWFHVLVPTRPNTLSKSFLLGLADLFLDVFPSSRARFFR